MEKDHRSLHPEPVGGEDVFSDGDCPIGSLLGAEERLNGLYRSEGRLSSGSDSPIELQIPQVHHQREGLAVQGPLLRSVHSTVGVYTGYGSCVWFLPSVRRLDTALSGRLADSCVVSQGSLLGKGQGLKSTSRIGNCDQFGEVFSNPDSLYSLSGDQDRVADFPGFSVAEEFLPLKGAVCEVLEGSAGSPRSGWSASNEGTPACSQTKLGLPGRLGLDSLGRSSAVVCLGLSRGGCFSDQSLSRPNVLVRHLRSGLGHDHRRPIRGWSVVGGRGFPVCQSSEASCGGEASLHAAKVCAGLSCCCVLGQLHRCVLPSSSGRNVLTIPQ